MMRPLMFLCGLLLAETAGGAALPRFVDYLGGADDERVRAVAAHPDGGFVIAAEAVDDGAETGGTDVLLIRIDADWNERYRTRFGGGGADRVYGLALDAQGDAWIVGRTDSTDLAVTPDALQSTLAGSNDGLIARIDAQGDIAFATYVGGSGNDSLAAVAVDSATGTVWAAGSTGSDDFPGAVNAAHSTGHQDAVLLRFVGGLVTSRYVGGAADDAAAAIGMTAEGVYVAGSTDSADFDGAVNTAGGMRDAFVLHTTGTDQAPGTCYLGGSGDDAATVLSPSSALIAVAGMSSSTDFAAEQAAAALDGFVAVLSDVQLQSCAFEALLVGGSGSDSVAAMQWMEDAEPALAVAGMTDSRDGFSQQNAFQPGFGGGEWDGWFARVVRTAEGLSASYVGYVGGSGTDTVTALASAADGSGDVRYSAFGETNSVDLETVSAMNGALGGAYDPFVLSWDEGDVDLDVVFDDMRPSTVSTDSPVSAEVRIWNRGADEARDIVVTVEHDFAPRVIATADVGECEAEGTVATVCRIPELAGGGSALLDLTWYPANEGVFSASASASLYAAETNVANNSDGGQAEVVYVGGAGSDVEGSCFIATASYGRADSPPVRILREFRDRVLQRYDWGRGFIDAYYAHSPPMAAWIRAHPWSRPVVQAGLAPAVVAAWFWLYPAWGVGLAAALSVCMASIRKNRWK